VEIQIFIDAKGDASTLPEWTRVSHAKAVTVLGHRRVISAADRHFL